MISSEVQRTLVKSPPELWAELSDQDSLARHLGELGEIRITRVEPERTVEWEAGSTTGTVLIKASGWGTRVTLRVTRELPEAETGPEAELDLRSQAEPAPLAEPDPDVATGAWEGPDVIEDPRAYEEPDAAPVPELASESTALVGGETLEEPDPASEPAPALAPEPTLAGEPEPRPGFFARLFGRKRRREEPVTEMPTSVSPIGEDAPAPGAPLEAEAADPILATPEPTIEVFEPGALTTKEPAAESAEPVGEPVGSVENGPEQAHGAIDGEIDLEQPAEQAADAERSAEIAAELRAAEEAAGAEVTAVLTSVLDRLGAAHHRPFSRS